MKYGQTFRAQSVPQWAPYNVDYNELKNLIKVNTSKDQGQAIAIPGQTDTGLKKFEDQFFNELSNQHDRVDLFVKSKADEINRRLQFLEKAVLRLLARCTYTNGKSMSRKRRERFSRYDVQIVRCGEDAKSLQRFVEAQRTAFHKILKKYQKWTGSRSLSERFNDEILRNPKSFTRRDLSPLLTQYDDLLIMLRAATPDISEATTPSIEPRRPSAQVNEQPRSQSYWNEYDDGSEADNEPYTIYINPNSESTFPGAKTITYVFSKAKGPVEKVKQWWSPTGTPHEQRSLLANGNGNYFADSQPTDTEAEDDAYASSSDFPSGYATHYATFPSVGDQKINMYRDRLLFQATVASFGAALVLLIIASVLVATGRHRLRIEVDAGVIVGVVASLTFATLGFGTMLYRKEALGWLYRFCVGATFAIICILNGMLLVVVAGNTGV